MLLKDLEWKYKDERDWEKFLHKWSTKHLEPAIAIPLSWVSLLLLIVRRFNCLIDRDPTRALTPLSLSFMKLKSRVS